MCCAKHRSTNLDAVRAADSYGSKKHVGLFDVAGLTVWNSLPDELRDQGCTEGTFEQSLRTYLLRSISMQSALDIL